MFPRLLPLFDSEQERLYRHKGAYRGCRIFSDVRLIVCPLKVRETVKWLGDMKPLSLIGGKRTACAQPATWQIANAVSANTLAVAARSSIAIGRAAPARPETPPSAMGSRVPGP